jgi:hypothetical protein
MTATGLLDAAVCCGFFAGGLGLGPVGASAGLLDTPFEGPVPTAQLATGPAGALTAAGTLDATADDGLTIVGPAGALTTDGELGTPYEGAFPTA